MDAAKQRRMAMADAVGARLGSGPCDWAAGLTGRFPLSGSNPILENPRQDH